MKITLSTNINNIKTYRTKTDKKSSIQNLNEKYNFAGSSILASQNKNLISFKSNYSFDNFKRTCIRLGIKDVKDLESNINVSNLMGTGANSSVYRFNSPELDNWVLKVDKQPFRSNSNKLFTETPDELRGINLGQEIATAGDRYRILKKVTGVPHSTPDWSKKINKNSKVSLVDAWKFQNSLSKISKFSKSAFMDYAIQLRILSDAGYKQDSINPNNILIDYKTEKINIIDSFKAVHPDHVNSRLDLINALLDFSLFSKYYEKLGKLGRESLLKSSRIIISECNQASKKLGLPQDEETFLRFLAEVDKWFGIHLVNKGGNYLSRYDKMKELLPEINELNN